MSHPFPWKSWLAEDNTNPTADVRVTRSGDWTQARSESALAVNPSNPKQILAASKKFTDPLTYAFSIAVCYSQDRGNSWSEAPPLQLPQGWSGVSDPALAWDEQGGAYLLALPFEPPGQTIAGIAVYKSSDGGHSWGAPQLIHGSAGDDKQWIAGDASPTSPYRGHVYAVWDDGNQLRFARSTDHGATWHGTGAQAPGSSLANDSFSPEVSVAADGTVYVVYSNGESTATEIKFVKSTDGGASFTAARAAASGITNLWPVLPNNGFPHFPGSTFRVMTLATGCVSGDTVVFAWADGREQVNGSHISRIYYALSPDAGVTWVTPPSGQPLAAGVDPAVHHFHPQLTSTPSGEIGCACYELGVKGPGPVNKPLIDVRVFVSTDAANSFGFSTTVTDQPWDPAVGAPLSHGNANITFIGEYFGFDGGSEGFHVLWTDTRTRMQELFATHVRLQSILNFPIGLDQTFIKILFGVVNDGPGVGITIGGQVIPIPPRGPEFDIVRNLVIAGLARSIEDASGVAVQRAAYRSIGRIATGQASVAERN